MILPSGFRARIGPIMSVQILRSGGNRCGLLSSSSGVISYAEDFSLDTVSSSELAVMLYRMEHGGSRLR